MTLFEKRRNRDVKKVHIREAQPLSEQYHRPTQDLQSYGSKASKDDLISQEEKWHEGSSQFKVNHNALNKVVLVGTSSAIIQRMSAREPGEKVDSVRAENRSQFEMYHHFLNDTTSKAVAALLNSFSTIGICPQEGSRYEGGLRVVTLKDDCSLSGIAMTHSRREDGSLFKMGHDSPEKLCRLAQDSSLKKDDYDTVWAAIVHSNRDKGSQFEKHHHSRRNIVVLHKAVIKIRLGLRARIRWRVIKQDKQTGNQHGCCLCVASKSRHYGSKRWDTQDVKRFTAADTLPLPNQRRPRRDSRGVLPLRGSQGPVRLAGSNGTPEAGSNYSPFKISSHPELASPWEYQQRYQGERTGLRSLPSAIHPMGDSRVKANQITGKEEPWAPRVSLAPIRANRA
ncbi:hypothetical protein NMY22_g12769 [Coprinellus aureogranulatus]|nr:hypothetical protein NMY22_g12769 [Coprinellus aureogranulatus]